MSSAPLKRFVFLVILTGLSAFGPLNAIPSGPSAILAEPALGGAFLSGAESAAFERSILSKNAGYLATRAESAARLRARGWKPKAEITVQRVYRRASTVPPVKRRIGTEWLRMLFPTLPVLHAQEPEYAYVEEGYVVFTEWDDGDPYTWEGNMYVQVYDAAESWNSMDNQFFIPDEGEWYRTWAWSRFGNRERGPFPVRNGASTGDRMVLRSVAGGVPVRQEWCACASTRRGGDAGCLLDNTLKGSFTACSASMGACRFRDRWWSPNYWRCVGTVCTMAVAVVAVEQTKEYFRNCDALNSGGGEAACSTD